MRFASSGGSRPYRREIGALVLVGLLGCCPRKPTEQAVPLERSYSVQPGDDACHLRTYAVPISTVAFSPDGDLLATAGGPWERSDGLIEGGPGEVCLWDTATGQRKALCTGYNSYVMSLIFFPDGKRLITGGHDVQYSGRGAPRIQGEIKSWDLNGNQEWIIKGCAEARGLSISPDRKTLALAGNSGEVVLWSIVHRNGYVLNRGKQGIVNSVTFSSNGKLLASGGCVDNLLTLWDVEAKTEIASLKGHKGFVRCVAFTPDGRILASSSQDGTVKLWDISMREEVASLTGPGGKLQGLAISPDGKLLASGGDNKKVKLWNMATRQEVKTLSHKTRVFSLAFSSSSKVLAAGGADHKVKRGVTPGGVMLWNVETGQDITPPQ